MKEKTHIFLLLFIILNGNVDDAVHQMHTQSVQERAQDKVLFKLPDTR